MSYILIEGTFHVVGFQPDGDSVRFAANDVTHLLQLPNRKITPVQGKSIQLRLECIDALETHYTSGSSRLTHQPMTLAMAAREKLLSMLNFTGVTWSQDKSTVTGVDLDGLPGYILTNTFDSYGSRPVSYAFAGPLPAGKSDGDTVWLDVQWMGDSVNFKMVETGHAYPMYYEGAFHDLRKKFDQGATTALQAAAAGAQNIWASDVTEKGFKVPPDDNLTKNGALWPKLFRRVSSFLKEDPTAPLSDFPAWLAANRDPCLDLETGSWTALHNFVVFDAATGNIKLTKSLLKLMFKG